MSAPQVGVVIPVLNRREDTLECLTSLAQATYPNVQVYVVDNGSTDGSTEAVAARFPTVKLILLGENRGFARASNVGIRRSLEAGAQYMLLLNNDTVIAPDMIDALVDAADSSPAAGILTPRIMYYGEDRVWSMGSRVRPLTLATLDFGRSRQPRFPLNRMVQVDSVVGCGMFVARPVFEQIGLFDEAFFFYYEDLDFSIRARKAGFELWAVPWAKMWHKVSASTEQSRYLRFYYLAHSSVRFYHKHTAGLQRWLMVPYRAGSACRLTLEHGLRGDIEAVRGYWRGLCNGLLNLCQSSNDGEPL
jgi:GT2 family glycosyltransferase